MPLTDMDAAQVVWDTYYAQDKLTRTLEVDDVLVGIRETPDGTIICFRGSTTPEDWFRDFHANMIQDHQLGGVEAGFIEGLRKINIALPAALTKPCVITGHSLGAARAWLFAALMEMRGEVFPLDRLVVFGSPRPGGRQLADIINSTEWKEPPRSYRNRRDPVCDVPFCLPPAEEYVEPAPFIQIDESPAPDDPWLFFAEHHFNLYYEGIKKLFPAAIAA